MLVCLMNVTDLEACKHDHLLPDITEGGMPHLYTQVTACSLLWCMLVHSRCHKDKTMWCEDNVNITAYSLFRCKGSMQSSCFRDCTVGFVSMQFVWPGIQQKTTVSPPFGGGTLNTESQHSIPSLFTGVTFLKTTQTVKLWCAKLRSHGKNGVSGNKDT